MTKLINYKNFHYTKITVICSNTLKNVTIYNTSSSSCTAYMYGKAAISLKYNAQCAQDITTFYMMRSSTYWRYYGQAMISPMLLLQFWYFYRFIIALFGYKKLDTSIIVFIFFAENYNAYYINKCSFYHNLVYNNNIKIFSKFKCHYMDNSTKCNWICDVYIYIYIYIYNYDIFSFH